MKICVYAISKNEEQFVERFCKSAQDADLILIADTGSTDKTAEVAKAQPKTVVHDICISPWRFDIARNVALALIPSDITVCISLDLDEVLEPGWREEIERVWTQETTRLRYKFDWGCDISFFYEKIHHRRGYRWHHPVHEYPVPDMRIQEVYAQTDKLLVRHLPDPTKSRGQYLDLLKLSVTEDPACPRNAFYYARELTFYSKWHEAIVALHKYLDNPKANWANERCYAYRLLGKAYQSIGNNTLALEHYLNAANAAPNTREPWCDLAQYYYSQSQWQESLDAVKSCLAIKDRELVYTCDPAVWGALPHDLGSIAAWNLGLKDEARLYLKTALAYDPDDARLLKNQTFMEGSNGTSGV